MRKPAVWGVAALLVAGSLTAAAEEPSGEDYLASVPRLSSPPELDGRLDDAAWRDARVLDGFVQIDPDEGAPATEATEIFLGYDERNLYLGVRCHDSEPDKVVANVMTRDDSLINEDYVELVLDTYHDGKSGFLFSVNALGARADAVVRDEGQEVNWSWDGVWAVAAARDAGGWTAEIAIPFRTLRFPQEEVQTWGFNLRRTIARKREDSFWKPMLRSYGARAFYKISEYGRITGLEGIRQGNRYQLKPFVTLDWRDGSRSGDDGFEPDAGIDVKLNLTSELIGDLTVNTDFAEAEADLQQINLTRFPLYFPEKREFFLEGSNFFYFGDRSDLLRPTQRIFFFSRRIGLAGDGRTQIPVLGGAKISGKLGDKTSLGFLNLTTDQTTYRDGEGEAVSEPRTNYTALRLDRRFQGGSRLGLIGLAKEADGGGSGDNRGWGGDWDLHLTDKLRSGGFIAGTETPGLTGQQWAGMADLFWDGRLYQARASLTDIGEDFNPELGFFPRTGIREYRGLFVFQPRLQAWKLRQLWLFNDLTYIEGQDGRVETRIDHLEADLAFDNWSLIALKAFDNLEVLDLPFEIHPGVVVAPGTYHFTNYFLGVQSDPSKVLFLFARYLWGDFWDGDFRTRFLGMTLRPRPGFATKITYEQSDVDLAAGSFVRELAVARVDYSLSPRLSSRLLVQWQRDENLSVNALVSWFFRPDAAFLVVYNGFREEEALRPGLSRVDERSVIAKLTFTY